MYFQILYIEDDIVTAAYVKTQLEQRGYVVELAINGKKGLNKLEEKKYDIVIVDYHLPDINGLQVLRKLAKQELTVPTIMITGAGNERIAVEAMKLGAGDYLIKDIDNHYLELLPEVIECEIEKQQFLIEKRQAENALHYHDTILEAVSFAAAKFLTCTHWMEPIQEILAYLGRVVVASRVYIFENHRNQKGMLFTSQRYEWVANGILPQMNNPLCQNFSYAPHFMHWAEMLTQGQTIYGLTKNLSRSEQEYNLLNCQDILSFALIPIFVGKTWWGFMGYDDCIKEREWSPVVIEAFKTAAHILGAAIQHDQMNQALRESEARLAKTQRIAHLGHCDWDIISNTRRLSEETFKIFGWQPTSHPVSNKQFLNAIYPADRKNVQTAIAKTITENEPYNIEFRITRSDGTIRYLHTVSELFRDSNGKPIRFLGTVQDITESKQIEKALRESTQTLSAILNAATDSVLMTELDTTCVIINPAGAARLERTVDEIIGQRLCELVAPEVASRRKHVVEEVIHTKQPCLFEDEERQNLWFEHSIYPVLNKEGLVKRIAVVSRDITQRKQVEESLARTLAEQQVILDNSLVGIAFLAEGRRFVRVNRKLEEICGYTEEELKGHTTEILYSYQKDYENVGRESYPLVRKGATYEMEHLMRHKNGTQFWCRIKVKLLDPNDLSKGYIWNLEDVTEQRRAEESLRLSATVFENTTEAIFVTNANNYIIMVNPAFTTITGYSREEVIGKTPNFLKSGHHDAHFYSDMWNSLMETGKWQGEIWNRRKNGELYVEWISIVAIRDSNHQIAQYVAIFSDITKRKESEELIWHQAHYDTLTNLPNRTLFIDRLTQAVQTAKLQQNQLAVMFIDLDRFKWVNDTLGHKTGDLLLQETAQRLTQHIRESDTVARLGGDEFTVILTQMEKFWSVKNVAQRLLSSLSHPFILENHEVSIGGSIGIACFPEDGQDVETLIKNADIAMYQAKEDGRNAYRFFTAQMNSQITEHLQLERALRNALVSNEFVLYYQPIIALDSEQIMGVEALLRWQPTTGNQMFPEQFLPLAENTGLIIPIEQWWLTTAISQLQKWYIAGFTNLQIAINVSAYQLRSSHIIETITEILQKTGLSPHVLILEVSENILIENLPEMVTALCKLSDLGVQIAIDDFGSGWASLHCLRQFPIDILKIDPFFIHHVTTDAYDTMLTETIIALAHKLKIKVVGEGVDTNEQLAFLRSHQCDLVQGQYFSKPLTPNDLAKLLLGARSWNPKL